MGSRKTRIRRKRRKQYIYPKTNITKEKNNNISWFQWFTSFILKK